MQNLTTLSVEVHAQSRGELNPDPEVDPIQAVFYSILNDIHGNKGITKVTGVIIVDRVSADNENARKERQQKKSNNSSVTPPSTRTPSPQPSTSRGRGSRSPSPRPSTPKRSKAKGKVTTPPPRRFFADQDIPGNILHKSGIYHDDLEVTFVREEEEIFTEFIRLMAK